MSPKKTSANKELDSLRAENERLTRQLKAHGQPAIFNLINEAVFILDRENSAIIDSNNAASAMYGYTKQEFRKISIEQLSSGEGVFIQEAANEKIYKAATAGSTDFIWHAKRKDDSLFWVRVDLKSGIVDGVERVISVVKDIDEQMRTTIALRDSEERSRALSNAAFEALVFIDHGKMIEVNDPTLRMFGYTREEIIGRQAIEFISPEFRDLVGKNIHDHFEEPYEAKGLRKNGSTFWAEFQGKMFEYRNKQIRCTAVRDISLRKIREDALREQKERYRNLFNLSPTGIFVLDENGIILDANPAYSVITQYDRDELIGRHVGIVSTPKSKNDIIPKHIASILAGKVLNHTVACQRKDGINIFVQLDEKHIILPNGKDGILSIARDITEKVLAERDARKQFKELKNIHKLTKAIISSVKLESTFELVFDILEDSMNIKRASILMFDDQDVMRFIAWRGISETYRHAVDGHSPWTPEHKNPEPVIIADVDTDQTMPEYREIFKKENIQALVFVPLTFNEHVIGKVMLYAKSSYDFSEGEIQLAQTLGNQVIAAIMRKRDEQALRESEQRFRSLFEDNKAVMLLVDPPNKQQIIDANKAACDFYGYKRARLLKMNMGDINLIDQEKRTELMRSAMKKPDNYFQFKHRLANAEIRDVEIYASPIKTGKTKSMFVIVHDITQRKKLEQKVIESERLFRTVIEQTIDGMGMANQAGEYVMVNQAICDMTGYSRQELLGENLMLLLAEDEDVVLFPKVASGTTGHRSVRLKRKNGEVFFAELYGTPITIENEVFALGIVRDITDKVKAEQERKKLEAQIQHAQKLESLGVLAGGIAHDFNNLLTGVLGNVGLAQMELPLASPVLSNIKNIENSAIRAADLCRQLLAYSGKGRFTVMAINLNDIVEEMTFLLESSISKKVIIRYNLEQHLPSIEVDVTQVRQVIMNLIINASDAIGSKSGIITISSGAMECDENYLKETYLDDNLEPGIYVYVEISDTGCGMPQETISKIFDPFYTTKFTGRGLGLAAVLGIMRGHNGAIKIYSEPERGTTFKILFPLSDKTAMSIHKEKSVITQWVGSGLILVADDEETIRALCKNTLERSGFTVICASDGKKAVEIFQKNTEKIKMVILDMTMPHLSGEEAFREMRHIRSDVKVLLSSGYNEQNATNNFVGKGLAGFLQKPYKPETLLAKIKHILDEENE